MIRQFKILLHKNVTQELLCEAKETQSQVIPVVTSYLPQLSVGRILLWWLKIIN